MANTDPFTPEEVAQILEAFFAAVGTRQYIGARYVPIFGRKGEESIIWDNSAPYEPLTIVLYQGNSFTSRQYVPEDVEITNEEFWAETGSYNAQIEQYRRETANALNEAQEAKEAVSEEEAARIAGDNAILDEIHLKDLFVIFGDSWSAFGEGFENWVSLANVANTLDVDVRNFAIGGSGYLVADKLIGTQISTAQSTLTADEKARTKFVILEGGVNDTGVTGITFTIFRNAVRTAIASCASMFPNAQIIYAPNMCSYAFSSNRAALCMSYFYKMKDDIKWTPGNVKSAPILPYFWLGFQYTEVFRDDNLHLNRYGAINFGKCILDACLGMSQDVLKHYYKLGNLLFTYDDTGNVDLSGTYEFSSGSVINLVDTANEFTEYLYMWTNVSPLLNGAKRNPLWNGTTADCANHGWIRYDGNFVIKANSDYTGTGTAHMFF